ncbi:hypothetical protein BDEG_23051 [Batrachochytrium dendrobatidis JEL423]|uniref:Uncharacterized protein n=1 Tax=Batrachochytrium dendrobatidis (strain JEL423) TaxID=403673 RepID=A0A177WGE9_BATDL|nr:hypothetical protein BDEG_23051 [Batrachochytrium dendrobatidis JEL423]
MGKKSIVRKENRLSSVTIEDTPEKLKRNPSSEEFLEKHFEEISFGGSAATENLKKVARETFANNDFIVVTDVKNLRDGFLYYALTVNEELPKKQVVDHNLNIKHFFDKMKIERKRPEFDIIKLRETFTEQGILFEDLMETGDLAITDAELEKYGIAQGGIRTAILAVIKSIIQ